MQTRKWFVSFSSFVFRLHEHSHWNQNQPARQGRTFTAFQPSGKQFTDFCAHFPQPDIFHFSRSVKNHRLFDGEQPVRADEAFHVQSSALEIATTSGTEYPSDRNRLVIWQRTTSSPFKAAPDGARTRTVFFLKIRGFLLDRSRSHDKFCLLILVT
jgi:hypothetical protein